MAISQNFPSTRPTLNLNFARSRKLDSRITFTRGSTATYVDDTGLIRTAGINEARFDYDPITGESLGLLIEESRTNIYLQSENFNTSPNTAANSTITANTTTAPDSSSNADKLVENSSTGNKEVYQSIGTITSGTSYTVSVFAKASGRNLFRIAMDTARFASETAAYFNLSSGTVTNTFGGISSTSIQSYPNGWYKCSATFLPTSTGASSVYITLIQSGTTSNYTGDGSSGIFLWGAQTEVGSFSTSYIPTVASSVTRSTDVASITGTNFSDWYNSTEGTLFAAARINALGGGTYPGITYIDDGTASNSIGFYVNDAGNDGIGAEAYVSNVGQYGFGSPSAIVPNQLNKVITAYKVNDFAAAYSMGGSVGTDNSGSVPTVNRLIIGDLRGNNATLNGTIAQISYYPVRLPNTQLLTLTK